MHYLDIFGLEFLKTMIIFEINTLKNEFSTYAVNFGIGFTFYKCPGYTFSECLGPVSGLFRKVYL